MPLNSTMLRIPRAERRWRRVLLGSSALVAHAAFTIPALLIGHPALGQAPTGANVAAGQVAITQSGNRTQVVQSTDRGIINWQGFSVGAGHAIEFAQPGRASVTLNRVTGADASRIDGGLSANGQVFLVNPNGIAFGQGARVDVGGLVATTTGIRDQDFMAGRNQFGDPSANPNAKVVNEGQINIRQGGYAALSAAAVRNSGTIHADVGTVVLSGAQAFTVDLHGDKLLSFRIDKPVEQAPDGVEALVEQRGRVTTGGGRVVLTARAAKGVIDNVVSLGGQVEGRTARIEGGEVVIDGGGAGRVVVGGEIDASRTMPSALGGKVVVTGDEVRVTSAARIDASGPAGGGTVHVGGGYFGADPFAEAGLPRGPAGGRTARRTTVDTGAVIVANATLNGPGGRVIVWSDDTTRFDGRIAVRGGPDGGDGGFAETSGKNRLQVGTNAGVDALAPRGRAGDWLLDPDTIVIDGAGGGNLTQAADTSDLTGTVTITAATINAATANVILAADTQITQNAGQNINIANAGVGIEFRAPTTTLNGAVTTNGGEIRFNNFAVGAFGAVSTNAALVVIGGNLSTTSTAPINVLATAARISANVTLSSFGGNQLYAGTFNATNDSVDQLTIAQGVGTVSFGGNVGNPTTFNMITLSGTGPTHVSGAMLRSSSHLTIAGPLVLKTDVTLFSNSGGSISVAGAIDSDATASLRNLSFIASGSITLGGAVGATTSLDSFNVNGPIRLGGNVVTSGTQTYSGAVTLDANTTLSTTNASVFLPGALNAATTGGFGLTFATGTGTVSLTGSVGATSALATLGGASPFTLVGTFDTTGTQSYGGAVALQSTAVLSTTNANVTFGSTINSASGNRQLVVNAGTARVLFGAAIGATTALASLSVGGTGTVEFNGGTQSVVTTGTQSYGPATFLLTSSRNFTTTNAAIIIAGAVNAQTPGAADATFQTGTGVVSLGGGVGLTNALGVVSATAATTSLGANVRTTGTQSYSGALVLTGNVTLSTTNANVLVGGLVDAAASGVQSFNINNGTGTASLSGAIGSTTALASIDLAGFARLHANVTTTGAQIYNTVTLVNTATLATTNSNVTFNGGLNAATGAEALTINAGTGTASLAGSVGGTTGLAALSVASGTTRISSGLVTTTSTQSYAGAFILGAATALSTTNANILFGAAVDGAFGLTLTSGTGTASFAAAVGATTALANLSAGVTRLGANVTTTGAQTYGALTLAGNATLATTNSNLQFVGTINAITAGGQSLTVSAGSGTASFTGAVGATTTLGNLNVGAGGVAYLLANVTTTGTQSYGAAVLLSGSPIFATTNADVIVTGAVNATATTVPMTVNIGTGTLTIAGGAGQTTALSSLAMLNGRAALGGSITTTAVQSYAGAVRLLSATTLSSTGANVVLASTLDGGFALTVNAGTSVNFSGAVGGTTALASLAASGTLVDFGGSGVTTTGTQSYAAPVVLSAASFAFASTNSAITFGGALNGAQAVTINAGTGVTSFGGNVGAMTALTNLTKLGTGTLIVSGDVTTVGTQSYAGGILINGNRSLNTTNASIIVTAALDVTNNVFAPTFSVGSGTVTLTGGVGGATALASLNVAGVAALGGTIVTVGSQSYGGAVVLAGNATLSTTNSLVRFGSTVDATATGGQGLTLSTGSANVTFSGSVGATSSLATLTRMGSGNTLTGALTRTTGTQSYGSGFLLPGAASTTFSTNGANILVAGSVEGNVGADFQIGAGTLSVAGSIGGTTNLLALTVGGNLRLDGTSIRGNGTLSFGGGVVLGGATVAIDSFTNPMFFAGAIDGAAAGGTALTLTNGVGVVSVAGAVGATTSLGSFGISGSGELRITGGTGITTTGTQSFAGAVLVTAANYSFTTTNSAIQFANTLNGASNVTLATGTGTASLTGAVGGATALSSLTASSAAGVAVVGANVTTTGTQSFNGALLLAGNAAFTTTNSVVRVAGAMNGTVAGFNATFATGTGTATLGGGIGATTALGTLTISGPSLLGNVIRTTGNQTISGAVVLTSNTTLSTSGGTLLVSSTVNATTSGGQSLTVANGAVQATLGGSIGATTSLATLAQTGTGALVLGTSGAITVQTTGTQSYAAGVLLARDVSFQTTNSNLLFDSVIQSEPTAGGFGFSSSVGTGTMSVAGGIGNSTALSTIAVTGAFAVGASGTEIRTTGTQSYSGAVLVNGNRNFSTTNSAIVFAGALNPDTAGRAVTYTTGTGTVTFAGGIGTTTAFNVLNFTAPIALGGTITAVGTQSYAGAVRLVANTTFSTTNAALFFGSTIDGTTAGAQSLSLAAGTGAVSLGGNIGATTSLSTLSKLDTGTATLNAGTAQSVTTAGTQSWTGAVRVSGSDKTFATTNANVIFSGALDPDTTAWAVTVNTGTGTTSLAGGVGATTRLAGLTVTGAVALGGQVLTTGNQSFNGAATLLSATTVSATGGQVLFGSTVDGAFALTASGGANAVTFQGSVGATTALASLTSANSRIGANITTTGAQSYQTVTLASGVTLATTNSAINLTGPVNSEAGTNRALTLSTGTGTVSLGAAVGATTALATLTSSGTGSLFLADVTTTGLQSYGGAVVLTSNAALSTTNSDIRMTGGLNGAFTPSFTVGTGTVTLTGGVGNTTNLAALNIAGASVLASVRTVGTQSYSGAILLTTVSTFQSTGGSIIAASTIDGQSAGVASLTLDAGANNSSLAGNIGSTTALVSLVHQGTGTLRLGGGGAISVATTNNQTYQNVVLVQNASFSSNNTDIFFNNSVNAASAGGAGMTVNAGSGTVTIGQPIGATTALSTLNVTGGARIDAASIRTTGTQSYGGAIVIGNNVTFSATNVPIIFAGAIDGDTAGTRALSVVSPTGTSTFGGNIGTTNSLASISVSSNFVHGGTIRTAGTQSYNGFSRISSNTVLSTTNSNVWIGVVDATTAGGQSLTVDIGTGTVAICCEIGLTTSLASLTVLGSGTTLFNAGSTTNVRTTGTQSYSGAVLVTLNDVIFSTTNSAVIFGGAVNPDTTGRTLTFNTGTGTVTLGGGIGGTTALAALNFSGAVGLGGVIRTIGTQSYGGAVLLTANTTLSTTNANVFLAGATDAAAAGGQSLALAIGTGTASLTGAIGGTTALSTFDASNGVLLGANVTTTGSQSFGGAILLSGAARTLATTNAGLIVVGAIDGGFGLTLAAGTGAVTFGAAVGATTALASFDRTGTGTTRLLGVTTTGTQAIGGAVILTANTTFASTNAAIAIAGAIDSDTSATARALTLTAGTGTVTLGGALGATSALASLSTAGTSTAVRLGGSVTTTGIQSYAGGIVLTALANLSTTNAAITVGGAIDGTFNLTLAAGGGAVNLGGNIGATTALAAFSTAGTTSTISLPGTIRSTGTQLFDSAVVLTAATTISTTNSGVQFSGTVNGAFALTTDIGTGGLSFAGAVGATTALASLTKLGTGATRIAADITTVGTQSYAGALRIAGAPNVVLGTTNADILVTGAIDDAIGAGGRNLTIAAGSGTVSLGGAVGGTTELGSFLRTGAGLTVLGGNVSAANIATFGTGELRLGATTAISVATGNGTANFGGAINATATGGQGLTVATGTGTAIFSGAIGGTSALASLDQTGAGTVRVNGVTVTTTGTQNYAGAVILQTGAVTFSTTNAALVFGGAIDGAQALTLSAGTAAATLAVVGGTTALTSLTRVGTGTTRTGGNISTAGTQSYGGAMILGAATTLATSNAAIDVAGVVDSDATASPRALTLSTGTGSVSLGGAVGATSALASFTNAGTGNFWLPSAITTTGTQSFAGAVMLAATATLTTTNSNVGFGGGVNGGFGLTVSAGTGVASFATAVGGTTALSSLDIGGAGGARIGGNVTTAGTQAIAGGLILTADAMLTTTGANISLTTVNSDATASQRNFALSTGGGAGVVVVGAMGATTALASFTGPASGGGVQLRLGGNVVTSGTQSFAAGTQLTADVVFSATNANIVATGGVNSMSGANYAATFSAGSGTVSLANGVGGTTALSTLSISGIAAVGGQLQTTGTQSFGGAVTLVSGTTLTTAGAAVTLAATVTGANQGLTLVPGGGNVTVTGALSLGTGTLALQSTAGTVAFNGGATAGALTTAANAFEVRFAGSSSIGAATTFANTGGIVLTGGTLATTGGALHLASSTTTLDGTLSTSGGALTLGVTRITGALAVNTSNGDVTFGAIDSATGNRSLSISAGSGTVSFGGATGGTTALSNLSIGTASRVLIANAVTTTGTQAYAGAVDLGATLTAGEVQFTGALALTAAATITTAAANGRIALAAIDSSGASRALTLAAGTGTISLAGAIGATTALASMNATAGVIRVGGNVTTVNSQSFGGAVILTAGATLSTTNAAILFGSTIDGTQALTLNAGTGTVSVIGAVGATTTLSGLTIAAAGGATFDAAATVTGGTGTVNLQGGSGVYQFASLTATGLADTGGHTLALAGGTITNAVMVGATGGLTLTGSTLFDGGLQVVNTTRLGGTLRSSGDAVTLAALVLTGGATIDTTNAGAVAAGAGVTISGAVDGGVGLTVQAGTGGTASFAGAVGGTTALTSLAVTANAIQANGINVTTTANQAYSGGATVGGTLTTTSGTISFANAVTLAGATTIATNSGVGSLVSVGGGGSHGLTLTTTTGTITASGALSGLNSLSATAGGGTIAFNGSVSVGATAVNLAGSGGGTIAFNGGLTAGSVSAAAMAYVARFTDATITSATTLANTGAVFIGGSSQFSGGIVRTAGQTQLAGTLATTGSNAVQLGAVVLSAASAINTTVGGGNGAITTGTVDGGFALTVAAGTAAATLGAVGATTALAAVTLSAGTANVVAVTTTASQDYSLGTGTITLGGNLTSNTSGSISLSGTAALGAAVTIQTTAGAINLGAATGGQPLTLNAAGGTIGATGQVNGLTTLTIANATGASFAGTVSIGTVALTGGTGTLSFGASLSATALTTAAQAYHVALANGSSVTNAVTFANTGGQTFNGTVTFVGGVTASAGTSFLAGLLRTGGQAAILGTAVVTVASGQIDTTNGGASAAGANITVTTLNGQTAGSNALTLTGGTAGVVSPGAVGQTTALQALTVTGATIALANVRTSQNQTYTGAVNLGGTLAIASGGTGQISVTGATALTADSVVDSSASNGQITLGTVDSQTTARALTLAAGTGNLNVGAIGATTAVANLTVNSAGTASFAAVSTNGTGTVSLAGAIGTASFAGLVTANAFAAAAGGARVVLNQGAAITTTGSFANTGGVTLAQTSTFTGGLTASASTTTVSGTIATTAAAVTLGVVTLAGATNIATANGAVTTGAVNGGQNLTVAAGSGTVSLGVIGGTTALGIVNVAAGSIALGGNITTAGAALSLTAATISTPSAATTSLSTAGGAMSLGQNGGTIVSSGGTGSLRLQSNAGTLTVPSQIANFATVTVLTTNTALFGQSGSATPSFALGTTGTINVTGASGNVTFQGTTAITGRTIATSGTALTVNFEGGATFNDSAAITFANTGGITLGVAAGPAVTFSNPGGFSHPFGVVQNAGVLHRTAGQALTFSTIEVINGGTTYDTTDGGAVATGANITIAGIDSASGMTHAATLAAGTAGTISIGAVGATTALSSLTVNSAALVQLNAVTTTANQTYNATAVTLGGNLATTGVGAISFGAGSTVTLSGGNRTLSTAQAGSVSLQTLMGGGNGLTITAGTAGSAGAITIGGNASGLTDLSLTAGAAITLSGSTNATGTVTFARGTAASTGAVTAGTLAIGANMAGTVALGGAVTLGSVSTAAAAYTVAFAGGGTITSATTFTNTGGIAIAGTTTFDGGVTNTAGVTSLNGTLATSNDAVTLSNAVLTGASSVSSGGGAVTIVAANGNAQLTVNAGAGTASFGGIGQTTALAALTVTAGAIVTTGASTTSGNQSFTGPLSLGGNLTTTGGGNVNFGTATLTTAVTITTDGTTDGAINATAISATNQNLNVAAGSGTLGVTGAVALGTGRLQLDSHGGASFGGTVNVGTLSLVGGTNTASFGAAVTTSELSTGAASFAVAFNAGAAVTGVGATTLQNTGIVAFGGTSTFAGALTRSAGATSLGGVLRTNAAVATFAAVTLTAASTLDTTNGGAAATGAALTTGAIDGAQALTVQAGTAGVVTLGAIGGTTAATQVNVTGQTIALAAVTSSGSQSYVGAATLAGTLTVNTAGSGVGINGAVTLAAGGGAITLTGSSAGNVVSLPGAVNATAAGGQSLNVTASGGAVSLVGGVGQTTALGAITVSTGTAVLANTRASGAVSVTATAINLGGTIQSTGAGNLTLSGAVTLTGAANLTTAGGAVSLNTVAGAGNGLTLDAGAGAITASGQLANIGTLTLAGGASGNFAADVGVTGVVAVQGGTGTWSFQGALNAGGLTTTASAFALAFNGGGNVTSAVTLQNTGMVAIGDAAGDTFTFAGGLTRSGASTIAGTVQSQGQAITLGAVTLTTTVRVATTGGAATAGADLTVGAVDGAQALTLDGGTAGRVSLAGAAGGTTALSSLTVNGGASSLRSVTTSGSQSYAGQATLAADSTLTTSGGALTLAGVTGASRRLQINTGGGSVSATGAFAGLSTLAIQNSGGAIFQGQVGATAIDLVNTTGTIRFDGGVAVTTLNTQAQAFGLLVNGGTVSGATTLSNTGVTRLTGNTTFAGGFSRTGVGATELAGTLATAGGAVTTGALTLINLAAVIDTTNGGAIAAGGNISTGAIDGAQGLTLNAGTGGTLALGAIGGTTMLSSLNLTGVVSQVGAITTTGAITVGGTFTTTGTIATSGGSITSTGTLSLAGTTRINTSGGAISLARVVGGSQNLTLDAGTGATAGSVTVTGDITGVATLTLAGSRGARFEGVVGTANPSPGVPQSNVTLTNTGAVGADATVTFVGAVNANNLYSDMSNFSLELLGGGDVVNGDINNQGGLGLVLAGSTTFRNGLSAVNVPITLQGTLSSPGQIVPINKLRIRANSVIDTRLANGTGGANITINEISGVSTSLGTLTLNAGTATLSLGPIGATTAPGGLVATAATIALTGAATTRGAQTWTGRLNLSGTGGTFDSSAGDGDITINGAIASTAGTRGLTFRAGTGRVTLSDAIGTGFTDLTVGAGGGRFQAIQVTNAITIEQSSGSFDFAGAVNAAALTGATGAYGATFASSVTVTGGSALSLGTTGAVAFQGALTAMGGIDVAAGNVRVESGMLRTGGSAVRVGSLSLTQALEIDTTNNGASAAGATIQTGAINGAFGLTVRAGSSTVTLGAIGANTALSSLTVTGGTLVATGGVRTSGAQSFNGSSLQLAGTFATAGGAAFAATGAVAVRTGGLVIDTSAGGGSISLGAVDAASGVTGALTLRAGSGAATIGAVGAGNALASIDATAGGITLASATTSGNQRYAVSSQLTLGGALAAGAGATIGVEGATRLAGGGAISIAGNSRANRILLGDVDGTGTLALGAAGGAALVGNVGAGGQLGAVTSTALVTLIAGGGMGQRTRHQQMLTSGLATYDTGTSAFDRIERLAQFLATQGDLSAATVRTVGAQTFENIAVAAGTLATLGANAAITVKTSLLVMGKSELNTSVGSGAITVGALDSVVAYRHDVAIKAGGGTVTIGGIGLDPPVGALTIDAGKTTFNGDVKVASLTVNGAASLGGNVVITTNGGTGGIRFNGELSGDGRDLTINATGGEVALLQAGGIGTATIAATGLTGSLSVARPLNLIQAMTANITLAVGGASGRDAALATLIPASGGTFMVNGFNVRELSVSSVDLNSASGRDLVVRQASSSLQAASATPAAASSGSSASSSSSRAAASSEASSQESSDSSDSGSGKSGGKSSGGSAVVIPGLLSQEAPRSAAADQGVPGLRQRFPGMANTALW
jgi:filamentous hemagglutinin family protein